MDKKLISLGMLLSWLYISSNANNVALVPQTGQTSTVPINPAPTGSDGALQKGKAWPTTRFVLDARGNCITDTLTGLMWVKDLNTVNGGNPLNWSTALTTANNGTWCGYDDWRVPNINELNSLVNYAYASQANWLMYGSGSLGSPACNGACFVNIQVMTYCWSSSSSADNPNIAWDVSMSSGYISFSNKSSSGNQLFPVRGGQ